MKKKELYVAWQDPESRRWHPVGKLTREKAGFCFVYLRGATHSPRFVPFGRMLKLESAYISDELFPLFANRLMPKTRPEYAEFLAWLGLGDSEHDELDLLARSGGLRTTDSLEMFPLPQPDNQGRFDVIFFSHGIRHLSTDDQIRIKHLMPGDHLYLMKDVQNPFDSFALLMRTGDPIFLAGYCPRYYAASISRLVDAVGVDQVKVRVEQTNSDAPAQFRLQCRVTTPWPEAFKPFEGEEFESLADLPSGYDVSLAETG